MSERTGEGIANAIDRRRPITMSTATVYLVIVAVFGAELLVYTGRRWVAIVFYAVILGGCVLASVYDRERRSAYHALVCVPVFRLVDFGMPVFTDRTLVWLLVVYTALLPAVHFAWRANDRIELPLGGWRGVGSLPIVIAIGAGVALVGRSAVEFPILAAGGVAPAVAFLNLAALAFVGCIEEIVFRGVLQDGLVAAIGRWRGMALATAVFGSMYAVYGTPIAVGFGVGFGAILALAYRSTRSLLAPMALHATANLLLFAAPVHRSLLGL